VGRPYYILIVGATVNRERRTLNESSTTNEKGSKAL